MSFLPANNHKIVEREVKIFIAFFFAFLFLFIALLYILFICPKMQRFYGREYWVLGYFLSFFSLLNTTYFSSGSKYPNKTELVISNLITNKPYIKFWWKLEYYLSFLWILGFILIFLSEFNLI